jgi:hypothetical protein
VFVNEYVHLNSAKAELAESQRITSEINLHYAELRQNLLKRIGAYDEVNRQQKVSYQGVESIRSRILEIEGVLNRTAKEEGETTPHKCIPAKGSVDDCNHVIEIDLLAQEFTYLKQLHGYAKARYDFDWLFPKDNFLREVHAQAWGQLQENEQQQKNISGYKYKKHIPFTNSSNLDSQHSTLLSSNQNAALNVKQNRDLLEIEREKIIQYQNMQLSFSLQEANIENKLSPLYAHIYDDRQLIESHWITQILKPVFGLIPLLVVILFVFTAFVFIAQFFFQYIDRQVASPESTPTRQRRLMVFLLILCCIPLFTIFAYKWHQHSEQQKVLERRSELISGLYAKIEQAQIDEEKAIVDRVSMFASELSQLKEREENIGRFAEEMLSLKAQWSALKDVVGTEAHQKMVESNFSNFIISPVQMESRYKLTAELCLRDIESIENKLFVSMGQTYIEQTGQDLSEVIHNIKIDKLIGSVADTAKNSALEKTATTTVTTITTTLITFFTTFNPFAVIAADLAANLSVEKLVSNYFKDQVKKEIDNISEAASLQLRKELLNHIQLRNDLLKKKLGEQI